MAPLTDCICVTKRFVLIGHRIAHGPDSHAQSVTTSSRARFTIWTTNSLVNPVDQTSKEVGNDPRTNFTWLKFPYPRRAGYEGATVMTSTFMLKPKCAISGQICFAGGWFTRFELSRKFQIPSCLVGGPNLKFETGWHAEPDGWCCDHFRGKDAGFRLVLDGHGLSSIVLCGHAHGRLVTVLV